MKIQLLLKLTLVTLQCVAIPAFAAMATGKVTEIQIPANDGNTIYFKLDPMPQGVTKWFYVRNASGSSRGCTFAESEKSTDRAYSALLTAKASSNSVEVGYCLDSAGYGLVNGYVRVNPE